MSKEMLAAVIFLNWLFIKTAALKITLLLLEATLTKFLKLQMVKKNL